MADLNTSCFEQINTTSMYNLNNTTLCLGTHAPTQSPLATGSPICKMNQDPSVYPLLVLCLLAVLENAFTCYIIHSNKILRTATNIFVFSLCMADGLCAGVLLPVAVFCKESLLYGFLAVIIVFTYCTNLSAVTYERLISITKPLLYQSLITKRVALRIAIFAWVMPTCFSLLPLIWQGDVNRKEHFVYMIVALLVFLVAPFFFICFVYTRISIEVHRLLKTSRELQVYSFLMREEETQDRPPKSFVSRFRKRLCWPSLSSHFDSSRDKMRSNSCTVEDQTLSVEVSPDLSAPSKIFKIFPRTRTIPRESCLSNDSRTTFPEDTSFSKFDDRLHVSFDESRNEEKDPIGFKQSSDDTDQIRRKQSHTNESDHNEHFEDSIKTLSGINGNNESYLKETAVNGLDIEREAKILYENQAEAILLITDGNQNHGAFTGSSEEAMNSECAALIDVSTGQPEIEPTVEGSGFVENEMRNVAVNGEAVSEKGGQPLRPIEVAKHLKHVCLDDISELIEAEENSSVNNGKATKAWDRAGKKSSLVMETNHYKRSDSFRRRRSRALKLRNALDEVRASTAFAAVAVTYMFTWIPVIYMTLMEVIGRLDQVPLKLITDMNTWAIALNAAVDPLFYALILKNFRKTIKKHFRKMRTSCQ
eukprot:gene12721-14026_t